MNYYFNQFPQPEPTVGIAVGNRCCYLLSVIAVGKTLCDHTLLISVDNLNYYPLFVAGDCNWCCYLPSVIAVGNTFWNHTSVNSICNSKHYPPSVQGSETGVVTFGR